jgi:hypothetical protein
MNDSILRILRYLKETNQKPVEQIDFSSLRKISLDGNYKIKIVYKLPYSDFLKVICEDENGKYGFFYLNLKKATPNTNLGKLIKKFGNETDNWIGKTIKIEIRDIEGNKAVIIRG